MCGSKEVSRWWKSERCHRFVNSKPIDQLRRRQVPHPDGRIRRGTDQPSPIGTECLKKKEYQEICFLWVFGGMGGPTTSVIAFVWPSKTRTNFFCSISNILILQCRGGRVNYLRDYHKIGILTSSHQRQWQPKRNLGSIAFVWWAFPNRCCGVVCIF